MAKSSIQGVSPAPAEPAGRDTASLGPGDNSDSGSDMMGIEDSEGGDPGLATDVAARDELGGASLLPPDALTSTSDATGTGESRSAGGDSGKQDGWDIGVDRVFTPGVADADAGVHFRVFQDVVAHGPHAVEGKMPDQALRSTAFEGIGGSQWIGVRNHSVGR